MQYLNHLRFNLSNKHLLQKCWFVWQWISSIFHQQKNVDFKFKIQGMSAYKNHIEISTFQCIHSSKNIISV